LNKLGKEESLTVPLGYKCSTADVVIKSAQGKKNMTQIEVMENVSSLEIYFRGVEILSLKRIQY